MDRVTGPRRPRAPHAAAFAPCQPARIGVRMNKVGDDARPLMMAPEDSIDVDTPLDLELLECLLARQR